MWANPVKTLVRGSKQKVYYFQTLTLPYFTRMRFISVLNGKAIKTLFTNIAALLIFLAVAHWVKGDGGFDGHGRVIGRFTLYTNNFTHSCPST